MTSIKHTTHVPVTRTRHRLLPDARRVLARPLVAATSEVFPDERARIRQVLERLLALPEPEVQSLLAATRADFIPRHRDLESVLEHGFQLVAQHLGSHGPLTRERRLLIGAVFTLEYAIEAAALFNPSMVVAPDQSGVAPGARRFVLSLRAVGEGHISSIEFRSGTIDDRSDIVLDPVSPYLRTGHRISPTFSKPHVRSMAAGLGADPELCSMLMALLPDRFDVDELEGAISRLAATEASRARSFETVKLVHLVAASNYEVVFPADSLLSERVLVPAGPRETHGMEDARFVRFVDDDGSVTYYGTYTAFDGFGILPQLIETRDFHRFRIATLDGPYARNKGMAMFPRRIDGRFAALARHDQESLHIVVSEDGRTWNESRPVHLPRHGWGVLQIGNCGSPIETGAGWLVLTHGVGPMRRYCIGAALLDLEDPSRVIGGLPEPLLVPEDDEREGYVPNVVYSCGAMVHGDQLVLPYGYADYGTRIATIPMEALLRALRGERAAPVPPDPGSREPSAIA